MGLLDDAIREHLELKRRRGADPTEVERAEHEALGPVRRNRDASAVADPEGEPLSARAALDEPANGLGEDTAEHPILDNPDDPDDSDESPTGAPAIAYDHAADDDHWASEDEETRVVQPPAGATDPPVHPPAERRPLEFADGDDEPFAETAAGETTEYDVEEALAAEATAKAGAEDDEDVLEETPEFLQDTPDHDRLWFEQRPPRDFDFDG